MNIEYSDLDMILNYLETTNLEDHNNYSSEFSYKDQKLIYNYIKRLQEENKQLKEIKKFNNKLLIYNANITYNSKKFIELLENKIEECFRSGDCRELKTFQNILQKYKELIGDDK